MDINDLHPADDYTNRFFIWHEWIQANGFLTEENVFDYFATSMFYDKQSNNQVLRMQTMHTGVPIANEAEELKRFTGIEFAVVHAEPPTFFIIHKRERLSPDEVKPLAAYFIINNRIYQSPDLYSLLSNRLLTSVSALQTSLDILRKKRPDYTPRTGFVWPIVGEASTGVDAKKSDKGKGKGLPLVSVAAEEAAAGGITDVVTEPSTSQQTKTSASQDGIAGVAPGGEQRRQNTMLLMNAMRTTAMHSKIVSPAAATILSASSESVTAETPMTASALSSSTPAPTGQEAAIKGMNPTVESSKAAGKKRKKKLSLAAPTPAAS